MIELLLGMVIGGALTYYLTDIFHQEENEVNEYIIDNQSQKLRHYETEIKMLKGKLDSSEDEIDNLRLMNIEQRLDEVRFLKEALSTVYYDSRTNSMFTIQDEEIVELGQL